jgi:hypothetical protein
MNEILYCHATRQTRTAGPGHWFFDTGSWTACGEMGKGKDGRWHVILDPDGIDRKSSGEADFATIDEALQYVSEYFGLPVRRVKQVSFQPRRTCNRLVAAGRRGRSLNRSFGGRV